MKTFKYQLSFITICITFFVCTSISQTVYSDLKDNYSPLVSKGEVPPIFTVSTYDELDLYGDDLNIDEYSRKQRIELRKHINEGGLWLEKYLHSGQALFGNEVSDYLMKIKDRILEENGMDKNDIQIYLSKSSRVNAFAVGNGFVTVNLGLVARAKSESDLAFIIAHEISHVTEEHSLVSTKDIAKIVKGEGEFENTTLHDRMGMLTARSQDHELEADLSGVKLMIGAGYSSSTVIGTMELLQFEYYPFEQVEISHNYMKKRGFDIPESFFLEEVNEVNPEEDYFDEFSTHPNIRSRKDQLRAYLDKLDDTKTETDNSDEDEFLRIRELARFELIRSELINGEYGSSLYHTLVLRQKYPDNKYLKLAQAKSLYFLSSYKLLGKFNKALPGYADIQGESQRIFYLLKSLTKEQLSTISLKVIYQYSKDPELKVELKPYIDKLTFLIRIYCGYDDTEFSKEYVKGDRYPKNYDELKKLDQKRYDRYNEKYFYRTLLREECKESDFRKLFAQHDERVDSFVEFKEMPADDRTKIEEKKKKNIFKNGPTLSSSNILFAEPIVYMDIDFKKEKSKYYSNLEKISNTIRETAEEIELNYYLVDSKRLISEKVDDYNNMSTYNDYLNEINHIFSDSLVPSNSSLYHEIKDRFPDSYLCTTLFEANENGAFSKYLILMFEIETGKLVYTRQKELSNASGSMVSNMLSKDISKFKQKEK